MNSDTGRKSRNKGANGEREFIRRVAHLTEGRVQLRRNLTQCRDRGDDCGTDRFSIEIKRWKKVSDALVRDWWKQCQRTANEREKIPILAFRADQQCWQVLMHPNLFFAEIDVRGCIRMDLEMFCQCIEHPTAFHGGWFEGL